MLYDIVWAVVLALLFVCRVCVCCFILFHFISFYFILSIFIPSQFCKTTFFSFTWSGGVQIEATAQGGSSTQASDASGSQEIFDHWRPRFLPGLMVADTGDVLKSSHRQSETSTRLVQILHIIRNYKQYIYILLLTLDIWAVGCSQVLCFQHKMWKVTEVRVRMA